MYITRSSDLRTPRPSHTGKTKHINAQTKANQAAFFHEDVCLSREIRAGAGKRSRGFAALQSRASPALHFLAVRMAFEDSPLIALSAGLLLGDTSFQRSEL
ncbi:hypothetical protein NDU88_000741 [Pleurodeles waltl]|uniref:Uncharacterized protein n=1 Tax=Pleurodeles waltl TaxID=8319 RepID=A0AAV7WJS8_PLEWA|nr:hypothetical protein NDU88_000741 [Pleurodeles waltl]